MFSDKIISSFSSSLYAFIPRHVGNRTVYVAYELLRKVQRMTKKNYGDHMPANEAAFQKHLISLRGSNGYIEDQMNYMDLSYGKSTLQSAGCGIIAVYNILTHLGCPQSLPQIISAFEKDGLCLDGKWGTSPGAIRDNLVRCGLTVRLSVRREEYDALAEDSHGIILTVYNDKNDIRQQLHTIAVTRENGQYTAHNVSCDGQITPPHPTLDALLTAINGGRAAGIVLIGIKNKAAVF